MRALTQNLKAVALKTPLAPYRRFQKVARPLARSDMSRLGTDYGGWTVPHDLIDPAWVCYCGGVGNDISFDLAFIERFGCSVHAFDPTPSSIEYVKHLDPDPERFRFFPWGLWSEDKIIRFYAPDYSDTNFSAANLHHTEDYFEAPCRSLPSIMREFGHEHIDFLKLDIEGAEYEVLQSVLVGAVAPYVLCVEFHKTDGIWSVLDGIRPMVETVRKLNRRGYIPVWVDGYDVTFVLRSGRSR